MDHRIILYQWQSTSMKPFTPHNLTCGSIQVFKNFRLRIEGM